MPWEEHLLVDQRVRRVLGATLGGEGIQLLQHEQQQLPLRVHGLSGQVNEHVPSEQQPPNLGVGEPCGWSENRPEARAKE